MKELASKPTRSPKKSDSPSLTSGVANANGDGVKDEDKDTQETGGVIKSQKQQRVPGDQPSPITSSQQNNHHNNAETHPLNVSRIGSTLINKLRSYTSMNGAT